MKDERTFEVIIVGAGIAGASLAYFLAQRGLGNVLVLEREEQPGQHATGRSASVLSSLEPAAPVLRLKCLGGRFLRSPPPGFSEHPLHSPTGILTLEAAGARRAAAAREHAALLHAHGVKVLPLSAEEARALVPVLETSAFAGGVLCPEDGHIDVHELLWSYLRHARRRGAQLRCGEEVTGFRSEAGRCRGVRTRRAEYRARVVVNAAGAWAGPLAEAAGAAPVGLTPRRRTMVQFASPDGIRTAGWPMVVHEPLGLYFKPESGGVLASPMDEDPQLPCDARPDEMSIALAMERLDRLAPALVPRSLQRTWAGLRTFAGDGVFVVGEDPRLKGFFWLAGLGGAGIETSPAVGALAADLLLDGRTARFDASLLAPERLLGGRLGPRSLGAPPGDGGPEAGG